MAGAARLPSWGFVVVGVAACCALATVSIYTTPAPASLLSLPGEGRQNTRQNQQVLSFLTKATSTGRGEASFLAKRLGVKEARQQILRRHAPAVPQEERSQAPSAHSTVVDAISQHYDQLAKANYDVPYFSSFIAGPGKPYTKHGMHDAVRHIEERRALEGRDDHNGKTLDAAAGRALVKRLEDGMMATNYNPAREERRKMGAPLTKAAMEKLGSKLDQGIAYVEGKFNQKPKKDHPVKDGLALAKKLEAGEQAVLHPAVEAKPAEKVADSRKLGEELSVGMQAALSYHHHVAPPAEHALDKRQGLALADKLVAGEHWASTHDHKAPVRVAPKGLSMAQAEKLAAGLDAATDAVNAHWRSQAGLKKPVRYIKGVQDKRLSKRLRQGLKQEFPAHHPVTKHFMGKRLAKQIEHGAAVGQALEAHNDVRPAKKFVTKATGPKLAAQLNSALHKEMRSEGIYVTKFVRNVSGKSPSWAAPQPAPKLVHGMSAARARGLKLEHELEAGQQMMAAAKASKAAKAAHGAAWNHQLTRAEGRKLAAYLAPVKHIAKGAAPALAYTV